MDKSRTSQGKFKKDHTLAKFIGSAVIAAILVGLGLWYHIKHPLIETKTVIVDTSSATFAAKIDSLEKSVVEQVRACESGGHKESEGLIVFDSNKVASIGTLQFQVHTVIFYEKSLYNKVITGKEAIEIALDDAQAGQLAQAIMFTSPNLATDWANCSNKLSLTATIQAIKKIK